MYGLIESLPDIALCRVEIVFLNATKVSLYFVQNLAILVEFATSLVQSYAIDVDRVESKLC